MPETDIFTQLTNLTNPNKFILNDSKYIISDLKCSKNQFGYHWSYSNNKKKYTVSSLPNLLGADEGAEEFIKSNCNNKAKFIIDSKNIIELWLMIDGEFVALDEDIIQYKSGENIRRSHGFNGFTFFPTPKQDLVKPYQNLAKQTNEKPQLIEIDDIKNLIAAEKQKFAKQISVQKDVLENKKPSIPLVQKKENLKNFVKDFDNQIHKIFKNLPGREINISNDGFITFVMMIEENSQEDIDHKNIVSERNHHGSKLDTIDGEAMFAYLMNPIYEHLGFDKREDPDRKHYKGMGDSGDFKYGTTRLDMKTRRKENNRFCNLLVNKGHEDYNMYGLVLREGDRDCQGEQRRLSFVGVASKEVVCSNSAQIINKSLKYEVGLNQLSSLRDFILDVLLEVIQKDEI